MLFRLHQHLYDRLSTARSSSAAMAESGWNPGEDQVEGLNADGDVTAEDVHGTFLKLLFKLLNSTIESSKYEDECRTLLGANSYVLFTLDKLILKLIKQVQAATGDELASKLLQLHNYELARTTSFRNSVYFVNACVL